MGTLTQRGEGRKELEYYHGESFTYFQLFDTDSVWNAHVVLNGQQSR